MLEKVLSVLESWVGYLEKASDKDLEHKTANAGKKNYTIFAKMYHEYTGENYQGQAWCAMFISVCFVLAFDLEKAKELLCGKLYSYCPYGMKAFKDKGQLYTTPKAGDIVFFLTNGVAKHTGFVRKVSGNIFYTIEGNTSGASGVVPNGGGVCKKSYTVNSNMRFGRPNYSETQATYNATEWVRALQTAIDVLVDGKAGSKTHAACPLLKVGSEGEVVRLMQQRLGEHFNIAVSGGYDGYFGSGTLAAVKAFQEAKGLTVDGEVGPQTWRALLEIETAKGYSGEFPKLPSRGYYQNGDGITTLVSFKTQIKKVQKFLNWDINAGLTVDGQYGDKTEAAVKEYQAKYGLVKDGQFGSKSLEKAKTIKK